MAFTFVVGIEDLENQLLNCTDEELAQIEDMVHVLRVKTQVTWEVVLDGKFRKVSSLIKYLLLKGRKLQALKRYRDLNPMGLTEAKREIDLIMDQGIEETLKIP